MRCARWPPMDCRRRKCRGLSTAGKQAFRQRPGRQRHSGRPGKISASGHPFQKSSQPQLPDLPPSRHWRNAYSKESRLPARSTKPLCPVSRS
jgi:hypothetical protein